MGAVAGRHQTASSRFDNPIDGSILLSPLTVEGEQLVLAKRSENVLKQMDTSGKEFFLWVSALRSELLGPFGDSKNLLTKLKARLSRPSVQEAATRSKLQLVETAAIVLYSSETDVPGELARFLKHKGQLSAFEPLILPLLSGVGKLPISKGAVFRTWRTARKKSSVTCFTLPPTTDELDRVDVEVRNFGFSSGCRQFLSMPQKKVLSEATNDAPMFLLCIKSSKGHELGHLTFSDSTIDEVVFLPSWRGQIVGRLDDSWKSLLGKIWSIDLTFCSIVEVCDVDGLQGSGFAVEEICNLCQSEFSRDKSNVHSCRNLVEMYRLSGRVDLQQSQLEHLLSLDPKCYDAHIMLAALLEDGGKTSGAIQHYQAALQICPRDPSIHNRLGHLLEGRSDFTYARAEYEHALFLSPNNADAHASLGKIVEFQGKKTADELRRAREHYEAALLVNPEHPIASFLLARQMWESIMFDDLGKHQKDVRRISELFLASIRNGSKSADARYWLGRFLSDSRVGKYDEARFQLEFAVHLDNTHSEAHNYLGQLLARRFPKEKKSSRDHLLMALRLNPQSGSAQSNLSALFDHDALDPVTAKSYYGYVLQ